MILWICIQCAWFLFTIISFNTINNPQRRSLSAQFKLENILSNYFSIFIMNSRKFCKHMKWYILQYFHDKYSSALYCWNLNFNNTQEAAANNRTEKYGIIKNDCFTWYLPEQRVTISFLLINMYILNFDSKGKRFSFICLGYFLPQIQ